MSKFTVRVPESFIDFNFTLYEGETMEDKDVLEALSDRAFDEVFGHDYKIELYGEDGNQIAIPGGESSASERVGDDPAKESIELAETIQWAANRILAKLRESDAN